MAGFEICFRCWHTLPEKRLVLISINYAGLARRLLYSRLSWGESFTNISQVRLRKHTTSWRVTSWLGLSGHLKAREDFGWVLPGRVVFRHRQLARARPQQVSRSSLGRFFLPPRTHPQPAQGCVFLSPPVPLVPAQQFTPSVTTFSFCKSSLTGWRQLSPLRSAIHQLQRSCGTQPKWCRALARLPLGFRHHDREIQRARQQRTQ